MVGMADEQIEFQWVKRRADDAWNGRSGWDSLYEEAYRYCMPMRRPGKNKALSEPDHLFDMTSVASCMHFAGNLQRDLFPAGQSTFSLRTGPVARLGLNSDERQIERFDRHLEKQAQMIHPFFQSGDWDTAVHECCLDLAVGTGALLPVKGTPNDPVQFACIPCDQIAILVDAIGRVHFISWRQPFTYEQVIDAFPRGRFSDEFRQKAKSHPNTEITLYQDFWANKGGRGAGWNFAARVDAGGEFITRERYRTQPIAVPRYYRVPGEAYGRGVVLTALPSIKTVNKAQEIALKAAAIQMLGIWGYRSGGTFNPDTVRIGPGEMWAMQSTGGVLGPDVQRIDPAAGRMEVARMLIGNLQEQIREAMFDERLPDYQGTPRSASEIAGRLQERANVHIGAFGRLVREIMPVIVPRVAEILYGFQLMPQMQMPIDHLLVSLEVQSPMQAALNAQRLAGIANYIEFIGAVAGPDKVPLYANIDKVLGQVADGLQIDKDLVPSEDEREQTMADMQAARVQQLAELFAQESAKQAPGLIAGEMQAAA